MSGFTFDFSAFGPGQGAQGAQGGGQAASTPAPAAPAPAAPAAPTAPATVAPAVTAPAVTAPADVKMRPDGTLVTPPGSSGVVADMFDMPGMGSAQILMLYGDSGTFKTSQLTTFVEYVFLRTGLITRVVTSEASCVEAMKPLVAEGMVQVIFVLPSMKPRAAMMKLIRGEWLYYFNGPNGQMLPPGQISQYMDWRSPNPAVGNYHQRAEQELKACGGYIFEGATTLSELCMQGLAANPELYAKIMAGKKNSEGQDIATGLSAPGYMEDGEMLGQHDRSHYGAIQSDALKWIRTSPKELYRWSGGTVKYVAWSSHEARGVDDFDKSSPIFGPALVGKAGGDKLQKEVGTMIHADAVVKADGKREVRFYFMEHLDPQQMGGMGGTVTWQAKPRITPTPGALQQLNQRYPGGYFVPSAIGAMDEVSLRTFLEDVDRIEEESRGFRRGRFDKIRQLREAQGKVTVQPQQMDTTAAAAPAPAPVAPTAAPTPLALGTIPGMPPIPAPTPAPAVAAPAAAPEPAPAPAPVVQAPPPPPIEEPLIKEEVVVVEKVEKVEKVVVEAPAPAPVQAPPPAAAPPARAAAPKSPTPVRSALLGMMMPIPGQGQ